MSKFRPRAQVNQTKLLWESDSYPSERLRVDQLSHESVALSVKLQLISKFTTGLPVCQVKTQIEQSPVRCE